MSMSLYLSLFWLFKQSWAVPTGEGGGAWGDRGRGHVPPFLSDQLTLSQPGGANYAHNIIRCSSDFQTFLWPCRVFENNSIFASGHDCDNFVPIDEVQTGHWPLSLTVCRYGKRSKNCGVGSNLVGII